MVGKYEPLAEQLSALARAGRDSVEFDFTEIAALVGQSALTSDPASGAKQYE